MSDPMIQDVFLETDWDDAEQARAAHDQRAVQLDAQGLSCNCMTLYRATDGRRVFLVEAQTPEEEEAERRAAKPRTPSRRPRGR